MHIKQNVAVIIKTVKEITPHMWEGGQSLLNGFWKRNRYFGGADGESKNRSVPRSSVSQLKCTVRRLNWRGRRPWEFRERRPPFFMILMGNNLLCLPLAFYRKLQSWGEFWKRKSRTKRHFINATLAVEINGVWEVTNCKHSDAGASDPWDMGGNSRVHSRESQESNLVLTCLCERPKT